MNHGNFIVEAFRLRVLGGGGERGDEASCYAYGCVNYLHVHLDRIQSPYATSMALIRFSFNLKRGYSYY